MSTPDSNPTPLGVGIIGYGSIGITHAEAIEAVPGLALRGTVGSKARAGVRRYDDAATLLADPEITAVAICSPSGAHAEHAIAALNAGKHVLIEKPVATSVVDAAAVVAAAQRARAESGAVAAVVAQRRIEPQHLYLKELLDSGQLGRPLLGEALVRWHRDAAYYAYADWRRDAPGGGSLMNQGLHLIDLLRWFFGEVVEVTAMADTLVAEMEAEDTTVAALRFSSGALGNLVTTTATPPGLPAELNLFTTAGAVGIHHTEVVRWETALPAPPESSAVTSGASSPKITADGHQAQWADLLRAIQTHTEPLVTVEDGAATVALIEAIYTSARTGERVVPRTF